MAAFSAFNGGPRWLSTGGAPTLEVETIDVAKGTVEECQRIPRGSLFHRIK